MIRTTAALLLALLLASPAPAQTLTNTGGLSFGSFVAGSGGDITVSTSGMRSKNGGVLLVSQGASASAAQFSVLGPNGGTVNISLPANGTVLLYSGGNSMVLNNFVSSPVTPALPLPLSGAGTMVISVGATLVVGSNQAAGSYSGSFSITVNNQ